MTVKPDYAYREPWKDDAEQAKPEFPDIRAETARRCAEIAYRVCAETRHVSLGVKAANEIAREFGLEEQA